MYFVVVINTWRLCVYRSSVNFFYFGKGHLANNKLNNSKDYEQMLQSFMQAFMSTNKLKQNMWEVPPRVNVNDNEKSLPWRRTLHRLRRGMCRLSKELHI